MRTPRRLLIPLLAVPLLSGAWAVGLRPRAADAAKPAWTVSGIERGYGTWAQDNLQIGNMSAGYAASVSAHCSVQSGQEGAEAVVDCTLDYDSGYTESVDIDVQPDGAWAVQAD